MDVFCFERGYNDKNLSYCCIVRFDNVIKQLVHASAVRMSRH